MQQSDVRLLVGDCIEQLRTIPNASIDAIVTDPPYPEIDRAYGRMTESEWHAMMRNVVTEARRVLKPNGSAVFVLQPNMERVGRMRPWLWEFMTFICHEWNMVQDAWWWNYAAVPTSSCQRQYGLLRNSVKACVWAGAPDCYRDQDAVLWTPTAAALAMKSSNRMRRRAPGGVSTCEGRIADTIAERGGVTPFNLLPLTNTTSSLSAKGHPASTPLELCRWWIRYLTKPGEVVLDCFSGSGTTGIAAVTEGRKYVGIERDPNYNSIARERIDAVLGEIGSEEGDADVRLAA